MLGIPNYRNIAYSFPLVKQLFDMNMPPFIIADKRGHIENHGLPIRLIEQRFKSVRVLPEDFQQERVPVVGVFLCAAKHIWIRQFELVCFYRNKEITVHVLQSEKGVSITLFGGDLEHIGAVGVVDPDGYCTVTEFLTQREGVVCEKWTSTLSAAGIRPVVISAGIHYDGLDKEGIQAVLTLTDNLLEETIQQLLRI